MAFPSLALAHPGSPLQPCNLQPLTPYHLPVHYIVCGMGHVGLRVVRLLVSLGESVVVITVDTKEEWRDEITKAGIEVIQGDARNERLLTRAGIDRAHAVLALTDHDLVNIEIALDVRKIREDIALVVRLFDQSLAQQLETAFNIRRALAVSALAAPTFAAAVLGESLRGSFRVDDELYVVGETRVSEHSPLAGSDLRDLWGRFSLLLLGHRRNGALTVLPELEGRVEAGDEITVLGCADDWDRITPTPVTIGSRARHKRAQWERAMNPLTWGSLARSLWSRAPLFPRILLCLLLAFFAVSTLFFKTAMNLSLIDAVYFVTTTVATVGFGDISPRDFGVGVKLYTCLLMVLGSATLAVLYSIITDFVVTARIEQLTGVQVAPRKNHVVVVGLGNVGYRIVDELRRTDTETIVIERDAQSEFVEVVRPAISVVAGDARAKEVLIKSDISRAAAIVAATDDDVVNLSAALAAKEMNPQIRTVVRFFDGDFAAKAKHHFKLDAAMSAAEIAAPTFVAAALLPHARLAFILGDALIVITRRTANQELAEGEVKLLERCGNGRFLACETAKKNAEEVLVASRFPLAPPRPV